MAEIKKILKNKLLLLFYIFHVFISHQLVQMNTGPHEKVV